MTQTQIEGPVLASGAGRCIGAWVLSKLVAAGVETMGHKEPWPKIS